jgi:F0F1-type ATP synthase membrane subunit b/b'
MKNKKIICFYIVTILFLLFSSPTKAQQKTPSATNKQAQTELESEQKRGKEKQSKEEKRAKKSVDKISDRKKYKGISKRKKNHPENH